MSLEMGKAACIFSRSLRLQLLVDRFDAVHRACVPGYARLQLQKMTLVSYPLDLGGRTDSDTRTNVDNTGQRQGPPDVGETRSNV